MTATRLTPRSSLCRLEVASIPSLSPPRRRTPCDSRYVKGRPPARSLDLSVLSYRTAGNLRLCSSLQENVPPLLPAMQNADSQPSHRTFPEEHSRSHGAPWYRRSYAHSLFYGPARHRQRAAARHIVSTPISPPAMPMAYVISTSTRKNAHVVHLSAPALTSPRPFDSMALICPRTISLATARLEETMALPCRVCSEEVHEEFRAKILHSYTVRYCRCRGCGFLQTEPPYWLNESYLQPINVLDTGVLQRNTALAKKTAVLIHHCFDPKAVFVDYTGGYGFLTRLMRDIGFDFYRHDPRRQNLVARGFKHQPGASSISLLIAFEVLDPIEDPIGLTEGLATIANTVMFTTLTPPIRRHDRVMMLRRAGTCTAHILL